MSSSSRPRARVIRGGAAVAHNVRTVPFAVDLTAPAMTKADRGAVEEAMTTGYRDGFDAGRDEGYRAGMAAAQTELAATERERNVVMQQALAALQEAMTQLRAAQHSTLSAVEDELANGAFAIAEAVLDRELTVAENPGRDAVARALALAPDGDAVVRLNPADVKTLGPLTFGRELSVVADPTVELAGAIVEVGACRIDAQIGTALERVREALA